MHAFFKKILLPNSFNWVSISHLYKSYIILVTPNAYLFFLFFKFFSISSILIHCNFLNLKNTTKYAHPLFLQVQEVRQKMPKSWICLIVENNKISNKTRDNAGVFLKRVPWSTWGFSGIRSDYLFVELAVHLKTFYP